MDEDEEGEAAERVNIRLTRRWRALLCVGRPPCMERVEGANRWREGSGVPRAGELYSLGGARGWVVEEARKPQGEEPKVYPSFIPV